MARLWAKAGVRAKLRLRRGVFVGCEKAEDMGARDLWR